jgi:hypothetical protein
MAIKFGVFNNIRYFSMKILVQVILYNSIYMGLFTRGGQNEKVSNKIFIN